MEHKLNQDEIVKTADTLAGGSILAWFVSLSHASEVVALIAGIVAIIAGCAATWFHVEKALETRRRRKESRSDLPPS